jgi:hypothetical protein
VVRQNLNDTQAEYVEFDFGHAVNTVKEVTGFVLLGYNVDTSISSASARLLEGDANGVLAAYPAGTDVAGFTMASVDTGTVTDEVGKANVPSSVALGGAAISDTSPTDAPELVSVRTIPTLEQVEFSFSRQLDRKVAGNPGNFGFYTLEGRAITAKSMVTAVDRTVTMAYDRQVEDGVLYFAKAGAVKDARGLSSTPNSVGRPTTAPNLVSISDLIGKTQFDFTFDRPITDPAADRFTV